MTALALPPPSISLDPSLPTRLQEDMQLRGLAPATQEAYRGAVLDLATFCGRPIEALGTLTEDELRRFFLHLVTERGAARSTLTIYRSGIRFFVERTLRHTWPVLDFVRPAKACTTTLSHRCSLHRLARLRGFVQPRFCGRLGAAKPLIR